MELVSIATLAAKLRKPSGKSRRIPDRQIRFRCAGQVVESLQIAEARLRYQRSSVIAHPANRLCHPGGIACEQLVIFRRAEKTNDAQFDNKIIDDLLRLFFG